MVRIATEKDPEVLRQAALLLASENERLSKRLAAAISELAALKGATSEQLNLQIAELERDLQRIRDKAFESSKSERQPSERQKVESKKKEKSGHGPKPQPKLEIVEAFHALDDADKTCTSCGGMLGVWEGQHEESFEVDVIPRRFVLKRHLRMKYRCACGGCIETAPGPVKLCEGARYSVDFAIEVATFVDVPQPAVPGSPATPVRP